MPETLFSNVKDINITFQILTKYFIQFSLQRTREYFHNKKLMYINNISFLHQGL